MKTFKILSNRFCHGVQKIGSSFELVAVICQYKNEVDEPLFDILVDDVVFGGPVSNLEELIESINFNE